MPALTFSLLQFPPNGTARPVTQCQLPARPWEPLETPACLPFDRGPLLPPATQGGLRAPAGPAWLHHSPPRLPHRETWEPSCPEGLQGGKQYLPQTFSKVLSAQQAQRCAKRGFRLPSTPFPTRSRGHTHTLPFHLTDKDLTLGNALYATHTQLISAGK